MTAAGDDAERERIAMARFDPAFAEHQLLLLCRVWYMHPSGQLPAYEFAFDDVNPPVHAWAVWHECPTGSGRRVHLGEVAEELERRLVSLVLPDASGRRPCHGEAARHVSDPAFRDLVLFYEYFDGDTGRGLGASHQTGWTALAANLIERVATTRSSRGSR